MALWLLEGAALDLGWLWVWFLEGSGAQGCGWDAMSACRARTLELPRCKSFC